LAQFGVDALPVEAALDTFESLMLNGANGTFMVTSRFGPPWHVSLSAAELPLLRFIDKPLLHYPGVELVIETELSGGRDLYLADHRVEGSMVVPAVLGLEAMAQVAGALAGQDAPSAIEAVTFSQAIHVPDDGSVRVRIMALAADSCRVEVAIRAEHDAFATECMRATLRFGASAPLAAAPPLRIEPTTPIDAGPLYGPLLFQGKRFRCIRCFTHVSARRITALLLRDATREWFSAFQAQRLVLGDPGIRDALLHALQAAVPHRRVIPVSASRIAFHPGGPPVRADAIERGATADTFEFDIVCRDSAGVVVEEWHGVLFRAISNIVALDRVLLLAPQFCAAYVERTAREILGDPSIEVALIADRTSAREKRRGRALAVLGLDGQVFTRSDGKPVVAGDDPPTLSISHCEGVTLAVKAIGNVGSDLAAVSDWSRPDASLPLSASAQAVAAELASDGESWAAAAARVWGGWEAALKHERVMEPHWSARRCGDGNVVLFDTAAGRMVTIRFPSSAGDLVAGIAISSVEPMIPAVGAEALDIAAPGIAVDRR
jgi:enediyne polyketide synthase